MKNILVCAATLGLALLLFACKESFEPNAPFQEKYVLNCLINADDSIQTLTITRGYAPNPDGSATPMGDLGVKDALVRIWVEDSVYFFHDTITDRTDGTHGGGKVSFYVCNFYRTSPGKKHTVEAILPDGKKLVSSFTMPSRVNITMDPAVSVPSINAVSYFLQWETYDRDVYFYPRLTLNYSHLENNNWVPGAKILPSDYISRNGTMQYMYPIPSASHVVKFEKAALTSAINDLLKIDSDKSHFKISGMWLDVYTLDKYLTSYYSNTAMQGGDFTIRLDEVDFTNVSGGLGVFAGYVHQTVFVNLNEEYIHSLGF
ncbi:MAG: DUF4249 domain-containing protein [Ignavibacteria bacterium]|nr:DUF4249 domain-containing protein [Ignavibacteria bacterium]